MKLLNPDGEKRALERANAARATITANREALVVERTVDWLVHAGWSVVTHTGYEHGHDIEATRDDGQRWIIEAKGCVARSAGDHNNFRALLGDILMKRGEGATKYSIAIPDLPHWRGYWARLPGASKVRLGVTCIIVPVKGDSVELSENPSDC
jgi:hypothetical protein